MSTIQSTITSALRNAGLSRYEREARPVVDALVARENEVIEKAREAMSERGVQGSEQDNILSFIGLIEPTVDPVAAQNAAGSPGSTLDRIAEQVNSLVEFARRHGFRG
jgi:hypothetical protein